MSDELVQRVVRVIAQEQRLPPEKVDINSSFQELGIDSMDGLTLLFALENEFEISIPDEAAKSIQSVRDACEGIARILERGATVPGAAPETGAA